MHQGVDQEAKNRVRADGRGQATVEYRRRRHKEQAQGETGKTKYYAFEEVKTPLAFLAKQDYYLEESKGATASRPRREEKRSAPSGMR